MIDRDHDLPIPREAKLLSISRGSVYYLTRPVSDINLALMRKIDGLHLEHSCRGALMQRRILQREGVAVSRRHVATLMQRIDIEALCPQPGISMAHLGLKIYPYMLRKPVFACANPV